MAAGTSVAEGREAEILDAATAMFAEKGYNDCDTQAVVERAGVGKGTLYRYFPSKRALFLAAVDRVMRRMSARIDAVAGEVADPLERLAAAIRAYLDYFAEHPEYVELLIQERALFRDRERPTYFAYRERNAVRWSELYRSLIAQGRLRDMPAERITLVMGQALYGTMFTNHFAGRVKTSEEQAAEILDVIFLGILSDAERERWTAPHSGRQQQCSPLPGSEPPTGRG